VGRFAGAVGQARHGAVSLAGVIALADTAGLIGADTGAADMGSAAGMDMVAMESGWASESDIPVTMGPVTTRPRITRITTVLMVILIRMVTTRRLAVAW
jgi:hypothetical protein